MVRSSDFTDGVIYNHSGSVGTGLGLLGSWGQRGHKEMT